MKTTIATVAAGLTVLGVMALAVQPARAAEQKAMQDYTVAELLEPCVEGDNDSRGGAVLELECEQYMRGFTDALGVIGGLEDKGICLPALNRADEVRWSFMRWAHKNFSDRGMPAADGLLKTLQVHFKCE